MTPEPDGDVEEALRQAWWPAVAAVAGLGGDLAAAEDAVQEACAQAVAQWPASGMPANPGGWLVAVARRRAIDQRRREAARPAKERLATREWSSRQPAAGLDAGDLGLLADEQLALLFTCCHPALDIDVRVVLTLRMVCGLSTATIAGSLLLPTATVAQRLVRAKRKIRDAGIRLTLPGRSDLPARLDAVLKVVYLTFTEGHAPQDGDAVVRADLCAEALRLARSLHCLLPGEPEAAGLLALIQLTAARIPARVGPDGAAVLLADQDRSLWDPVLIDQGRSILEAALRQRRPGPYQLQAAIAACHADAAHAEDTDWRQILALYDELLRFEPSPVVRANRAVAVSHCDGPAAGLALLAELAEDPRLTRWPSLHLARGALLEQAGQVRAAVTAYEQALDLDPPAPSRQHLSHRLETLSARLHAPPGSRRPDRTPPASTGSAGPPANPSETRTEGP